LADREAKKKDKTLTEIDQKRDNQKDLSLRIKEAISLKMTEESKNASDVTKRAISKEIVW